VLCACCARWLNGGQVAIGWLIHGCGDYRRLAAAAAGERNCQRADLGDQHDAECDAEVGRGAEPATSLVVPDSDEDDRQQQCAAGDQW
jgi:hypothetical protein